MYIYICMCRCVCAVCIYIYMYIHVYVYIYIYISLLGTHMIHISLAVHLVQCVQANCVGVWSPCRRFGILQTQIRRSSALIQTGWSSASKQIVWVYGHHAGGSESCKFQTRRFFSAPLGWWSTVRMIMLCRQNVWMHPAPPGSAHGHLIQYIYIYREKERERDRDRKRERERYSLLTNRGL